MKGLETQQSVGRLAILQKLDLLVKSTANASSLIDAAEKNSAISTLEKDTIIKQFGRVEDQLKVFYLLLNSKACSAVQVLELLNSTGNESVASILKERNHPSGTGESEEGAEKNEWIWLQKIITDNIDRLSSHTRNLGLVLCFASAGIGLISGKDRETIANYSALEIDQLKKFYETVSEKDDDAYGKLLKVLKMTNNNWALSVLEINE